MGRTKVFKSLLPLEQKPVILERTESEPRQKTIYVDLLLGKKPKNPIRSPQTIQKEDWRNRGDNRARENARRNLRNKEKRKNETPEEKARRIGKRKAQSKKGNLVTLPRSNACTPIFHENDCVGTYTIHEEVEKLDVVRRYHGFCKTRKDLNGCFTPMVWRNCQDEARFGTNMAVPWHMERLE